LYRPENDSAANTVGHRLLQNNRLTSLAVGMFAGLSALQLLALDGNQIFVIEDGVFSSLPGLVSL
jgi:hypothetical protein